MPGVAASQAALLPSGKSIGAKTFFASHPVHGELTVTRRAKTDPATTTVDFDVQLEKRGKDPEKKEGMVVQCCIFDRDYYFAGAASFGHSDLSLAPLEAIDLYATLHVFFAVTGQDLGMANFAISNVPREGPLRIFCENLLSMFHCGPDGYGISMTELKRGSVAMATTDQWTILYPSQQSDVG
jgi:hypothetical protein